LGNAERRPANYGRPRVYPLAGLLRCGSCGGKLITYLQARSGQAGPWPRLPQRRNLRLPGRVRIAAEPLEEYVAGYVIEMWKSPRALNIAHSDDDRMERIGKITSEMAQQLQEQKNEALRMKLCGEVDVQTYRTVTRELDAAHDQLVQEHEKLTSELTLGDRLGRVGRTG